MPPKMKPALSVPGKIAMPSAFMVIEAGMEVSEVDITSLSTVIDSRMRLASFEVGPSWARVEKASVRSAASVSVDCGKRPVSCRQ